MWNSFNSCASYIVRSRLCGFADCILNVLMIILTSGNGKYSVPVSDTFEL